MDTWPLTLQQKMNADDFQLDMGSSAVRTEVDVGVPKVRARSTQALDTYSTSVFLSMSEYQTFRTFFKTTLANGTLPFLMPDPFDSLSDMTVRFVEKPSIIPLGGIEFRVKMVLERLP